MFFDDLSQKVAKSAAPMNKEQRNDQQTTFIYLNDEETQPINALVEALTWPSVLTLPISIGHISLETDACTVQVRYDLL